MRFGNFVQEIVAKEIKDQYATVRDLAANINGGWEAWLQVQLYLRMSRLSGGIQTFSREEPYPGLTIRSDFAFVPRNANTTKTWVELKVQCKRINQDSAVDAAQRFLQDIIKIDNNQVRAAVGRNDTVGAVAVIPVNPSNAVTYIRTNFGNANNVSCLLVNANGIKQPRTLVQLRPDDPDLQNHALILYYIVK